MNTLKKSFALLALFALIQSCGKQPFACFNTNPEMDDIHVGQKVTFSPYCSTNDKEYFWQFYGNDDSIEFQQVVVKYFKDTGEVKVSLDVANGNKSARVTETIVVKP